MMLLSQYCQNQLKQNQVVDDEVEFHFVDRNLVLSKYADSTRWDDWSLDVFLAKRDINIRRGYGINSKNAKLQNKELAWPCPLGYKHVGSNSNDKNVVINQEEAHIVKHIFKWYMAGHSGVAISKKLEEEFNCHKTPAHIYHLLRNKFYIGLMYDKQTDKYYPHKYARIITGEDFELANKRLDDNSTKRIKTSSKEADYQSLIHCSECGRTLTPDTKIKHQKNGNVHKYVYYKCHRVNSTCKNKKITIEQKQIDQYVISTLGTIQIPDDVIEELESDLTNDIKTSKDSLVEQSDRLNKQILKKQNQIERAVELRLNDEIDESELKTIRIKTKEDIDKLQLQLSSVDKILTQESNEVLDLASIINECIHLYRSANKQEKGSILKIVCSNLFFDGKKINLHLLNPFDLLQECHASSRWRVIWDSNPGHTD